LGEKPFENKQVLVFVNSDADALCSRLSRAGAQVTAATRREEVLQCLQDDEEGQGNAPFL
jgi:hypothetical protein